MNGNGEVGYGDGGPERGPAGLVAVAGDGLRGAVAIRSARVGVRARAGFGGFGERYRCGVGGVGGRYGPAADGFGRRRDHGSPGDGS